MGTTFSCMVVVETINCLSTKTNSPNFIFVNYDFSTFSKNELKNHLIFSKNFSGRLVKAALFCVQRNNLTEYKFFIKKIFHFLTANGQLEGFQGNLFDKLLKRKSTCQDEHFDEFFSSFQKFLPHPFRDLKWRWSAFQQTSSTWSSKLQTVSPIDPFDDSLKTSTVEVVYYLRNLTGDRKMFNHLAKKFSRGVKTACHVSREAFWGTNFLKRKVCYIFLGFRTERKGHLDEHPLTGLLKLYITSTEKQAKQSTFCKFGFCKLSRRLRQDFWPFSKYFPTSSTEMHSTCLEKHFDG